MESKNNNARTFFIFAIITCLLAVGVLYFTGSFERDDVSDPDLFGDHQAMLDTIGDPVSDPDIPRISDVIIWLATDETNEMSYIVDLWMCGEYSTELVISAKEENWRIYVVIMYYSYYNDAGYNEKIVSGGYGHAFNMIYTEDGDDDDDELDLWYIEPQSDRIWRLDDGHYELYRYYSGGLDGTIWYQTYWINYYLYF